MNELENITAIETVPNEQEAVKTFKEWCREHHARISHWYSKTYWEYGKFWAFIVRFQWQFTYSDWHGVYGFHVKGNNVELIGKMPGYPEDEED